MGGRAEPAEQLHAFLLSHGLAAAAEGLLADLASGRPPPLASALASLSLPLAPAPSSEAVPAVPPSPMHASTLSHSSSLSLDGRIGTEPRVEDVSGGLLCEVIDAEPADFSGAVLEEARRVIFHPAEQGRPGMGGAIGDEDELETHELRVISAPQRTAMEESVNFPVEVGTVVAGRYKIVDYLGHGVFSRAVQCVDLETDRVVCLKILHNNKDFFDQGLMEIKVLKLLNQHDQSDQMHILRLIDYFYHREHLFIVCELLRDNLYELYKYMKASPMQPYFTLPRIRSIAHQCLIALAYMHSFGLMHCDLKPENIVVKSFSRCVVKILDFGSCSFLRDPHSSYVQSRSYRAPEVLLGHPYDEKIDIWSLACILVELFTSRVLFTNMSHAKLLAAQVALCGEIPADMVHHGHHAPLYLRDGQLFVRTDASGAALAPLGGGRAAVSEVERSPAGHEHFLYSYLRPVSTRLSEHLNINDPLFLDLLSCMLQIDPARRISALEALYHPWFRTPTHPAPVMYDEARSDDVLLANAPLCTLRVPGALRNHLRQRAATAQARPPPPPPPSAKVADVRFPGTEVSCAEDFGRAQDAGGAHSADDSADEAPVIGGGATAAAPLTCLGLPAHGASAPQSSAFPPLRTTCTPLFGTSPTSLLFEQNEHGAPSDAPVPEGPGDGPRPPQLHGRRTVPLSEAAGALSQEASERGVADALLAASRSREQSGRVKPKFQRPDSMERAAAPGDAPREGQQLHTVTTVLESFPHTISASDMGQATPTPTAAERARGGTHSAEVDEAPAEPSQRPALPRQDSMLTLAPQASAKKTPSKFRRDAAKERREQAGFSLEEGLHACMLHIRANSRPTSRPMSLPVSLNDSRRESQAASPRSGHGAVSYQVPPIEEEEEMTLQLQRGIAALQAITPHLQRHHDGRTRALTFPGTLGNHHAGIFRKAELDGGAPRASESPKVASISHGAEEGANCSSTCDTASRRTERRSLP